MKLTFRLLIALLCLAVPGFARAQGDDTGKTTIHVVQRGESLFAIAQQYGTTVEAIAQINGISDVTLISVGQRLLIPNVARMEPGVPTQTILQPGDTLTSLALRYGTTPASIAARNGIVNATATYVGMEITLLKGSELTAAPLERGWLHTVTAQDTLYRIALRHRVSVAAIVKANPLRGERIYPGQQLLIPGTDSSPVLADLPYPFEKIDLLPGQVIQGKTMVLQMKTSLPVGITGEWLGNPLVVITERDRLTHNLVFGVGALAEPGVYRMTLVAIDDQNRQYAFIRGVRVVDGGYAFEQLTLAPELADTINPTVIQPEVDRINSVVRKFMPTRYFNGPMGLPSAAAVTSQYGTRRSYNGGAYDFVHNGVDFAGAPGSPVLAPAAGVVVLAEALTVRGNATIIDHGWGVFTGYWHQTDVSIRVGDVVQPGQVIGTVGKTGRATGYHLHWELFIHGVPVDPLQWVKQSFS